MRLLRVRYQESVFYASLHDKEVHCLQHNANVPDSIPLSDVHLLPLVTPSKVICVGLNYRAHAEELGFPIPKHPLFFLKPPSALIGHGQPIVLPHNVGRVDTEAELALIVGQHCRHISVEDAPSAILGYTCANDITARELQKTDTLMGLCKGYDTFCPLGPWIETTPPDINELNIRCLINDHECQHALTSDMIFSPYELVSFLSQIMTLLPGDVILTGTPPGVSPLQDGDVVKVEIEHVGLLINEVHDAQPEHLLQ